MKKINLQTVLILILGVGTLLSFTNRNVTVQKEFMTIVVTSPDSGKHLTAHVSTNGQDYAKELIGGQEDSESKGDYDFNPVLQMLQEYQRGGWRIIASSMEIDEKPEVNDKIINYFFLERKVTEQSK